MGGEIESTVSPEGGIPVCPVRIEAPMRISQMNAAMRAQNPIYQRFSMAGRPWATRMSRLRRYALHFGRAPLSSHLSHH